MMYLLIRFITASNHILNNTTQLQRRRLTYLLLIPTTPSLLLQAASGISSESSCWQRQTIIGRAVGLSYVSYRMERRGAWRCGHGYHLQRHKLMKLIYWQSTD